MAWDENKHPRDSIGRFTFKSKLEEFDWIYSSDPKIYNQDDSYEDWIQQSEHGYDDYTDYPTILLSKSEYAMVMHELATNLTKEEHSYPIAIRHIRNYTYKIHVISFGNYRVIGKWEIRPRKRGKKK